MADPTPLLSSYSSLPELESPAKRGKNSAISVDEIIDQDSFPWIQYLQATLVSLAYMFDGQQSFISIFTDAVPSWHCTSGYGGACDSTAGTAAMCRLPRSAWAWDGPSHQTFVADWGLQCAQSILTGLPASSFFLGSLLGGFLLSPLADSSLGRKNLLLLSCAIMLVPAILTAFAENVWTYAALRFISGFGRAPIGTCALVLSMEVVGRNWRGQVGVIAFLCFALGFLSLPGIAYLTRFESWKSLYLWTALPAVLYCVILHFRALESPRWLYIQGRTDEAVAAVKRLAPHLAEDDAVDLNSLLSKAVVDDASTSTQKPDFYALLAKRWAFRRILAIGILSFGIGMVYYGIPLGVGNLGFNSYLGAAFNAVSEIPSLLFTLIFIGRWNRRTSVLTFSILGGACSILCVVIGGGDTLGGVGAWRKGLRTGSELVAFFCACVASAVSLIYTMELFPTSVRNSATAVARQAQVLGAVISPLLVSAGRKNDFMFYGVLGTVMIVCGLFVVSLPETNGAVLCDSMNEQDEKEREIVSV